jgi:hypothetical protein
MMKFSNRTGQSRSASHSDTSDTMAHVTGSGSKRDDMMSALANGSAWFRVSSIVLLFLVTTLLGALTVMFAMGNNNQEASFVNQDQYQAVFVNANGTPGGALYFGHIKSLTNQYIYLTNVFYLQNKTAAGLSSADAFNLVKMGCEVQGPVDQMIIKASQVYFWQNLQSNGQLSQKIAQFNQKNPNGQTCSKSTTGTTTTQASTAQPPATATLPAAARTVNPVR